MFPYQIIFLQVFWYTDIELKLPSPQELLPFKFNEGNYEIRIAPKKKKLARKLRMPP